MFISICYNSITYKTLVWFTLTPITTLSPGLIFPLITFNTKQFFKEKILFQICYDYNKTRLCLAVTLNGPLFS